MHAAAAGLGAREQRGHRRRRLLRRLPLLLRLRLLLLLRLRLPLPLRLRLRLRLRPRLLLLLLLLLILDCIIADDFTPVLLPPLLLQRDTASQTTAVRTTARGIQRMCARVHVFACARTRASDHLRRASLQPVAVLGARSACALRLTHKTQAQLQ